MKNPKIKTHNKSCDKLFGQFRSFTLALTLSATLLFPAALSSQTIKEKREALQSGNQRSELSGDRSLEIRDASDQIFAKEEQLKELYALVQKYFEDQIPEEEYSKLLRKISSLKRELRELEEEWRKQASDTNVEEEYALWNEPETTLERLIIEYGVSDYLYIVPPEIGEIKVSINSNLPVPRTSWSNLLQMVLEQNGIGVREVNPYVRELFYLNQNLSTIKAITSNRQDLEAFSSETRVCFVLVPQIADVRRAFLFLQKFADPTRIELQQVGGEVFVVGTTKGILELLKLYDFTMKNYGDKDYKLVKLKRLSSEEMAKILEAVFSGKGHDSNVLVDGKDGSRKSLKSERFTSSQKESFGLKVMTLENSADAIFLMGSQSEIKKAEEVIAEIDGQFDELKENTLFWYTCKHTDPEELATVLERVYQMMLGLESQRSSDPDAHQVSQEYNHYFYRNADQDKNLYVNPSNVSLKRGPDQQPRKDFQNFVVDPKTGSIAMVVKADLLPKIKDLLKNLDVPKKMVKIDFLVVEKRVIDRNRFGLNLLRIGEGASQSQVTNWFWNDAAQSGSTGILEFAASRLKDGKTPAYDLAYQFLITQEDVQINANPSVITVNQTEATIRILEERFVNTGVVEIDTAQSTKLKDSFEKEQYGIIINITPTIHPQSDFGKDDERDMVTLDTEISFDTIESVLNDRPSVNKRYIVNEVRIPDGETVILGGLKRKNIRDGKNTVPFLGEIPGVGKFFSNTDLNDETLELYIFITPHIVKGNEDELNCLRLKEYCRRPGDIPEFLECLDQAQEAEKRSLMQHGFKAILGRTEDPYQPQGIPR